MKLICDNCGEIDHVLVDGYEFGDRLLEGVMFIVRDKDGQPQAIGVTEDCQEYFNGLNTKKWLKVCEASSKELDIATCPKCGGEVPVWDTLPDEGNVRIIGERSLPPIPDKPLNEITKEEAKAVIDHIFEGCPTIDEAVELPLYKEDAGFRETVDALRKGRKKTNER